MALIVLTSALAVSSVPVANAAGPSVFSDVPPGHPFEAEITWLVDEGITSGFADGTFGPTLPVSRQATAAFMWRWTHSGVSGPPSCTAMPFIDVAESHPFCGEIAWLAENEIAGGWSDGTFRPTWPMTRQAMAAVLYRSSGSPSFTPPADPSFNDVGIAHPFFSEIEWLASMSIANGFPDGGFHPTGVVSRQAAAAFLARLGSYDDRQTTRVSVATDGTEGNTQSYLPSISADGRYVVFQSFATSLVAGDDTNNKVDVFLRDRLIGTTSLLSVSSAGALGDEHSVNASISADGRYVVFDSEATNLVLDDTNRKPDIFEWDRETGEITRVPLAPGGLQVEGASQQPSISVDGRYIAYEASATNIAPGDTSGPLDIYVWDRETGISTRISDAHDGADADDHSQMASISADGRFVIYWSRASNLVPGDTNGFVDLFMWDREAGVTTRVSVASDGTQANGGTRVDSSMSDDGRFVVYSSQASNLVPGDTNGHQDVFMWDRISATTTRISVSSAGTQSNDESIEPTVSGDGRYVAYSSWARNLVPADTTRNREVFLRDRLLGTTIRIATGFDGTEANLDSVMPAITGDGRYIAFSSIATNLVPLDQNGREDVFVWDRGP